MQKPKQRLKRIVDLVMIALLPLLMAEILIGQEIHEWLGTSMLVLFTARHILNFSWWKSFYRGPYTPSRALGTALDLLLFLDMAALGASGVMMSGFVFDFLPIDGGMILARQLHLFASHWGLILMPAHLGLHMELFMGMTKKLLRLSEKNAARTWALRIAAAGICVYGIYAFFAQHMTDYLFLQTHFVFFDETKAPAVYFAEIAAMAGSFAVIAYAVNKMLRKAGQGSEKGKAGGQGWKFLSFAVPVFVCILVAAALDLPSQDGPWQNGPAELQTGVPAGLQMESPMESPTGSPMGSQAGVPAGSGPHAAMDPQNPARPDHSPGQTVPVQDGFIFIQGGSFAMGSPAEEPWRSADETQHTVTVSDFYISPCEVKQSDYAALMGSDPSSFSGEDLPVENVSWLDAVAYCNARSEQERLTPAYTIDGETVAWDQSANGYRLPTEAEWEYACRAGTTTPFNTETSISPEESNYYGHYPYEIEGNYFSQENLSTRPGEYRQTTVAVDSFSPNAWGLYNMHGNVSEWVWDCYGAYDLSAGTDPTGPETGTRRVYRGGGWNDFAKNMRSAYRAALPQDQGSFNLGIRLVRNAVNGTGSIVSTGTRNETGGSENVLIAFFSWGGNTRGIAAEIQRQTGADLFEIELVTPYSSSYNTVLDEAQRDQNRQARPEIKNHIENFEQYDTILLGYPNWWASIPMPVASFLEEYDLAGKTIVPFCSHGGGRFGQSLTAIAKLAPDSTLGEGLSVHYSGGSTLSQDVAGWLEANRIPAGK